MASTAQFLGLDSFVWFQGVVEDRMDPLKLGRVRVRILGLHTEDKTLIPTSDLPWAYPMQPIISAAMNGIGYTPLGPVEGTWVIGFFRDGENCQDPVIMGTIGGIPVEERNLNIGFNDPRTKFEYPIKDLIGEPDTNRLARNYKTDTHTYVEQRKANLVTNINIALQEDQAGETDPDEAWDEPYYDPQSQYPFNHVYQTESGHVVEFDDTEGNRRIMEWHALGTFREVYEDYDEYGKLVANRITKINGNDYSIIIDDKNMYVQGSLNITADGRCNIYAGNDINIEANLNVNLKVNEDLNITAEGNIKIDAAEDIMLNADGDITFNGTNIWLNSDDGVYLGGDIISAQASDAINIASGLSTSVSSLVKTTVSANGSVAVGTLGILNLSGSVASLNSESSYIDVTPPNINLFTPGSITGEATNISLVADTLISFTAPFINNISPKVSRVPFSIFFN